MGLQGDHDRLIPGFPVCDAAAGIGNRGGKFMSEGDFGKDRFVSFVIKPGMEIGPADSTVGDPEKNFIIFGRGHGEVDQAGGPCLTSISTKGFHLRSAWMDARISCSFSIPKRHLIKQSPNSTAVPAPREVINCPSCTTG